MKQMPSNFDWNQARAFLATAETGSSGTKHAPFWPPLKPARFPLRPVR